MLSLTASRESTWHSPVTVEGKEPALQLCFKKSFPGILVSWPVSIGNAELVHRKKDWKKTPVRSRFRKGGKSEVEILVNGYLRKRRSRSSSRERSSSSKR